MPWPGGGGLSTSFLTDVAQGKVPGHSLIHKFGRNPDIDVVDGFESIWNGGGLYTGHNATAAEIVEIFSANIADDLVGTGARTLTVWGLDANYAEITETVDLDGTTPVDTLNSYIRLNRARVRSAGSGGENAGAITIRQKVTTANVFAVLPVGQNGTLIAAYTIPAGKTGYVLTGYVSFGKKTTSGSSNMKFLGREFGGVWVPQEELSILANGTSYVQRIYPAPKNGLLEKSDLEVRADTDTNNTAISAGFNLLLVDN